jgi:hypothetical protein
MKEYSRLDKLFYRVEAQHIALGWAFEQIAALPGPVFEIGLGHGRTYDHMRINLPGREIFVFDREIDCIADCTPPDDRLFLGDIGHTLKAAAERFPRSVVLAHADMGSYTEDHNETVTALLNEHLAAVLAPDAIVLSDLPLSFAGAEQVPLPAPAREGRYFLYRMRG